MQDTREYHVYPSDLNIAAAFREFNNYLVESKWRGGKIATKEHNFRLTINPYQTIYADNFDEFNKLLTKFPNSLPIEVHTNWGKKSNANFAFFIHLSKSALEVSVKSVNLETISAIHDKIREVFQSSNPHQERIDRLSKYNLKKSIFLAHKFDEYSNKQAAILNKLLIGLGFDVKEGSGYEAKDIPDKVASKIKQQDIFICLVTTGDTSWILSEAAFAKGLNKYIIIIALKDIIFNKGIIGDDYEHLLFPNENIEKCFSDLIFALPV